VLITWYIVTVVGFLGIIVLTAMAFVAPGFSLPLIATLMVTGYAIQQLESSGRAH
jgi:hypothetical protein